MSYTNISSQEYGIFSQSLGAAVRVAGGVVKITNSQFDSNTASLGGAIYGEEDVQFSLLDSMLTNNQTNDGFIGLQKRSGGALHFSGKKSNAIVKNSKFTKNKSTNGGAIGLLESSVTIVVSEFSENISEWDGGAIHLFTGDLNISKSTFTDNEALEQRGGAIAAEIGNLAIMESRFLNNVSGLAGGGIYYVTGTIVNSEFYQNSSPGGGAIFFAGVNYFDTFYIENTTISGNTASELGGGIGALVGGVRLVNSTIVGNENTSVEDGGSNIQGFWKIGNTIIADPIGGSNCNLEQLSLGGNVSSDSSCGLTEDTDKEGISDVLIGSLQNNGGTTHTHALLERSPAINAGNIVLCAQQNQLDQRYYYRGDDQCDAGAFEFASSKAETGVLGFVKQTYVVDEGDSSVTVQFQRTNGDEGKVSVVVYDTGNGSAGGGDYQAIPNTRLEWLDGDVGTRSIEVLLKDDNSFDGDKNIALALDLYSVKGGVEIAAPQTAEIRIIENDIAGQVELASAEYNVNEDAKYIEIEVIRSDGDFPFSVSYSTTPETARENEDYVISEGILNFLQGENTKTVRITIKEDQILEGRELFKFHLSNPTNGAVLAELSMSTINIIDNEIPPDSADTVSFAASSYTIDNSSNTVDVEITRVINGISDENATVKIETKNGSAVSGDDFEALSEVLSFAPGETKKSVTIL